MSLEDLIDTGRAPRQTPIREMSRMIGSADRLARAATRMVATLDDLIAEHGDMPIRRDLADRLVESINTLESAASEVSATTQGVTRHA